MPKNRGQASGPYTEFLYSMAAVMDTASLADSLMSENAT